MNVRLLSTVGLVAVAGALVATGCGSGDDSSTPQEVGGAGGASAGATSNGGSAGSHAGGSAGGGAPAGGGGGTSAGTSGGGAPAGGSGGASAGTGGATGGTGGATAGTGGTTVSEAGDTGTAGEAGASAGPTACVVPYTGILYDFDQPGSRGNWTAGAGFNATDVSLGDSSIARSETQGHSCLGSLAGTFPFTIYNATESGELEITYGTTTPAVWTGKTKLHAWVRVDVPSEGVGYLNGLQLHASSNSYGDYLAKFVSISTFATGTWQEIVLDLTANGSSGAPLDLTGINQLGLQVLVLGTAPAGGPAAPETTTVYLDDIWAE
jgi:hypothetical protein